jgi:uncharacterized protein
MHFKRAFITGATGGLGQALAHLLADLKIPLFLTGRNGEKLDELAFHLRKKVSVISMQANLTDPLERKALLERVKIEAPDLIINNAGFGLYGEAVHVSLEEQLEMVDLNIKALLEISLTAAKLLLDKKEKGVIVNISSAAAFFIYPDFATYAASKAFVNHFSQSLDEELRAFGIRVLASCPGQITTDFRKRAANFHPQKHNAYLEMTPEKAARAILYQIEKEKPLYIFDARYRMALFIARFFPKKWITAMLRRSIKGRYS